MPTFDTPDPIAVAVDLSIGGLHVVASERADTTVEVRASPGDRAYADAVTVDLAGGELRVTGPKLGLRTLLVPTPGRSLEVEIGLPPDRPWPRAPCTARSPPRGASTTAVPRSATATSGSSTPPRSS